MNARQLTRLEKDPSRRLQYLSQRGLNEAKALINMTDIAELKELDQQKYDVALQTYDKTLSEMEQYADSHKAEADKIMMFSSYVSSCKNFLKAPSETLARDVAASIQRELERLNSEFKNYAPADRRQPRIRLLPHADPDHFPVGVKHRYTRA